MIKKKMSLLLAAVLVATGVGIAKPASAVEATKVLPAISYIAPQYTLATDNAPFTFALEAANYEGDVQYRIFVQKDGGTWTELTDGYSEAVNAKVPYIPEVAKNLAAGKYKASIWVKRADVDGVNKNSLGTYDTYFAKNFSIGTAASVSQRADLRDLGIKDTYNVGDKISLTGKEGYTYKLHIYDPSAATRKAGWTIDATYETAENTEDDFTFTKPGTYLVDVWGMTATPSDAVKKQGYDGWALKVVTVEEKQGIAVESSIKEAMFGSLLTVRSEFPGAVKYQAYKDGEVLTKATELGKEASVFPAMEAGEEIEVKLLDAAGKVVATTKLNIGETAYVAAPEVKEANATATVKEAMFGSLVTVTTDFEGAVKFQLVDANGEVLTKVTEIGKEASVFPAMKAGEKVKVNLLDAEGTVLATAETTLK